MSITNVRAGILRFLESDKPQVLCIRGAWGTGKTYTWDDVLAKAMVDNKIKAQKYAKASLFGLNSLKELKREIFQSSVDIAEIGKPFDIKNVRRNVKTAMSWGKWLATKASFLHEDAVTAFIEMEALYARDQLILIDDLERKGEELRSVDVLGYISQLRDDRGSKVVLLLNDEELEDEPEFTSYLEKVVDVYLRFDPSGTEIAYIAVPETDKLSVLVRDNAIALGIDNVRVIRKLLTLVRDLAPSLTKYSETVTRNAAAAITLLGWSYFQPKLAPPLDYLKRVNTYSQSSVDEKLDLKWRDILRNYGFTHASEFDLLLLKGIENGYFDTTEIEKHGKELHRADERGKADKEMEAVWSEVHFSFTSPAQAILDKFFDTYNRNIEFISIGEMAALEGLFRELGDDRSDALVDNYIAYNKDNPGAFDLDRMEMFGQELPPAVMERIAVVKAAHVPQLSADEVLMALEERGFEEKVYDAASKLSVDDYLRILKSHEGNDLRQIMTGLKKYVNTSGLDPRILTVMEKAGEALRQLAAENPLNKRRAMSLGLIQRLDAKKAQLAKDVA
jgi:hypothetical protein